MLPRSDCHRIIHPLLSVSKLQLEDYMRLGKFEWREDSSNLLRKYKRNVVRLDLLPVMTQLAGGAAPLRRRVNNLGNMLLDRFESIMNYENYLCYDENLINLKFLRYYLKIFKRDISDLSHDMTVMIDYMTPQ